MVPLLSIPKTYAQAPTLPEAVQAPVSEPLPQGKEITIPGLIRRYSALYGVSYARMYATIQCETAGTFDPLIQSSYRRPDGSREQSFGLAQIFLPAHPTVSKAQAQDPQFAVEFMAEHFAKGDTWMWSCYRKLYASK